MEFGGDPQKINEYFHWAGLRLRKSKSDKMFFENICWVPLTQYDSNN